MHRKTRKMMGLMTLSSMLAACSTLQPVAPSLEAIRGEIGVDDRVVLLTTSADTIEATVQQLTDDILVVQTMDGQRLSIAFQDLEDVQVRRPAKGRTIGLALGIAAAVALIQLSNSGDQLRFPGAPTGPITD